MGSHRPHGERDDVHGAPTHRPRNRPLKVSRISDGGAQLLVGPGVILALEQMKVRDSTRATSLGLERAR